MVRGAAIIEARAAFEIYWKDELYKEGQSNALEISLIPGAELKEVSATVRLLSLGLVIERESLPYVRKNTSLYFYFKPDTPGRHIGRLTITCHDREGLPSVFESEDFIFHVEGEGKEEKGPTTFHIGDIISAGEVSLGTTKAIDRRALRREDSEMVKLDAVCNEERTKKLRKRNYIDCMMGEGKRLFHEGSGLVEAPGHNSGHEDEDAGKALDLLARAHERFRHVRQEEPAHEESLHYIERISELMAALKHEDAGLEKGDAAQYTSCILHAPRERGPGKVFLFSKSMITLGKDHSNDIAFPLYEYVSSKHAVIKVTPGGEVVIRDVGTDGKGSRNGTFLNGGDIQIASRKDYPLQDGAIINLGKSVGLFCRFLRSPGPNGGGPGEKAGSKTATGETSVAFFDVNGMGPPDAITLKSGNTGISDEYVMLIREITLGAERTNGIVIKGDGIADVHMKILCRDGLYMIEDLNSPEGTFLNGSRLEPGVKCKVMEKGTIRVGDVEVGIEVGE
jgi:pSer/pThr/pTyr-binding forkhead associated (FHA) protein